MSYLEKNYKFMQADRYRPIAADLSNRFGGSEKIAVNRIPQLPDFSVPLELGRQENFSVFIPRHRKLASRLIEIFMGL